MWLIFVCYLLQEREDELREQMRKLREMSVMQLASSEIAYLISLVPRSHLLKKNKEKQSGEPS